MPSRSAACAISALEPAQLVVELRPGPRIAVGQVEAADQHAVDRRLDIAAVAVVGIARQAAPGLDRLAAARQDRDAVPALLPVPDRAVAGVADRCLGELLARGAFSSCRQTTSGWASASHRSSTGSRPLTPFTL